MADAMMKQIQGNSGDSRSNANNKPDTTNPNSDVYKLSHKVDTICVMLFSTKKLDVEDSIEPHLSKLNLLSSMMMEQTGNNENKNEFLYSNSVKQHSLFQRTKQHQQLKR